FRSHLVKRAIWQLRAMAALRASSNAVRFITGNTPGMPMHTGQVAEFGGSPNWVLHPQNNLVRVSNWTWTSSPTTMRYGRSAMNSSRGNEPVYHEDRLTLSHGRKGEKAGQRQSEPGESATGRS